MLCLDSLDDFFCPERLWNPVPVLVLKGEKEDRTGRPRFRLHLLEVHSPVGESVLVEKVAVPEHSKVGLAAFLLLDRGLVDRTGLERFSPTIGIDARHLFRADEHWLTLDEVQGPLIEPHELIAANAH